MSTLISRRALLRTAGLVGGFALVQPRGRVRSPARTPATVCPAAPAAVLDLAATLEALTTTFFFAAISEEQGFFAELPTTYQRYVRGALSAEWTHYRFLLDQQQATAQQTSFFLPTDLFVVGAFPAFLTALDQLKSRAIAFYLAAVNEVGANGDALLAEQLGQVLATEAEHRVIGREMAQDNPPAPNDLCYERSAFLCSAALAQALGGYLTGGNGFSGPVMLPSTADVTSAVGASACAPGEPATAGSCERSLTALLSILATAEALGITFYYAAIQGTVFGLLATAQQWYLQAALDEERHHLAFLLDRGAALPPATYFFSPMAFSDQAEFLALLDALENAFVSAYLMAIAHFHALDEPLLAEIAGQIMGVEAEHRVLGRVLQGAQLPHDRGLARATFHCVDDIAAALQPFLSGNDALREEKPLPTEAELLAAIDRFGCTAVPVATPRRATYLPLIAH